MQLSYLFMSKISLRSPFVAPLQVERNLKKIGI